jgi:hypothetical protein
MFDFASNDKVLLLGMSRSTFLFINDRSNFKQRECLVWTILYTLMTRNGFKKVSPSLEILCKMTNLSQSTVQRGLRGLVKKRYLDYSPMYSDGKWGVNFYICLIPGKTIPEIKEKKVYRHYMPAKDSWDDIMSWNDEYCEMISYEPQTSNQSFHPSTEHYTTKTKKEIYLPKVDQHSIYQSKEINKHNIHCEILSNSPDPTEKEITEKIEEEKKLIRFLDEEKKVIEAKISDNIIDRFRVKDLDVAKKLLELDSKIGSAKLHSQNVIDWLDKELARILDEKEQKMKVYQDENYLAKKYGKRTVSPGLIWWIKKQLKSFGIAKDLIALKINEIIHAVRFGSLSHTKYHIHDEMPIMKSVNIALKLFKENKWQSPASFQYGGVNYG